MDKSNPHKVGKPPWPYIHEYPFEGVTAHHLKDAWDKVDWVTKMVYERKLKELISQGLSEDTQFTITPDEVIWPDWSIQQYLTSEEINTIWNTWTTWKTLLPRETALKTILKVLKEQFGTKVYVWFWCKVNSQ